MNFRFWLSAALTVTFAANAASVSAQVPVDDAGDPVGAYEADPVFDEACLLYTSDAADESSRGVVSVVGVD